MHKQEIIEPQTCRKLRWNGENDGIMNLNYCDANVQLFN